MGRPNKNRTGKVIYVPRIVIDELENVKIFDDIKKNSKAFRKMAKYSKVGRETKRIFRLDFSTDF